MEHLPLLPEITDVTLPLLPEITDVMPLPALKIYLKRKKK
jgi:hypothetical protein